VWQKSSKPVEILQTQLATKSTEQNDYRADLREILPALYCETHKWCVVDILKNQLATEFTASNDYRADIREVLPVVHRDTVEILHNRENPKKPACYRIYCAK